VRLITAHRILILCGIAFFVVYAVIRTQKYLARGDTLDLVQAVVALLVSEIAGNAVPADELLFEP